MSEPVGKQQRRLNRAGWLVGWLAVLFSVFSGSVRLQADAVSTNAFIVIQSVVGVGEVQESGASTWTPARSGATMAPGDRFRTGKASSAIVRLPDHSLLTIGELGDFQAKEVERAEYPLLYRLQKGVFYLFHRDRPAKCRLEMPTASAAIRGTELIVDLRQTGAVILSVLEGAAELDTPQGTVAVRSGEQAMATLGSAPTRREITVRFGTLADWCLYYPAILNPDDLGASLAGSDLYSRSLSAYRSGEVLEALRLLPETVGPIPPDESLYRAALLLAAGLVRDAESLLNDATSQTEPSPGRSPSARRGLVDALRSVIGVTQGNTNALSLTPTTSSAWLARSYSQQLFGDLGGARLSARRAAQMAPGFAFAWVRLAQLEFAFGRLDDAESALRRGLELAPRNPAGLTTRGFLSLGASQWEHALDRFDQALAMDPRLGDAWLGRGLCLIRTGRMAEGLASFEMATVTEPLRAVLRSYLGKARDLLGQPSDALHELATAGRLDPNDPTPWFYSALIKHAERRNNEAISDLERSEALNGNRKLYRSSSLLDQDMSVRSANLAALYRSAGLDDVAVREATQAVLQDPLNPSAHLFLASSFDALRDQSHVGGRHETVWFNELLLANMLSPAGFGALSQHISLQEYTPLFDAKRAGFLSSTEWRSDGQYREQASQYARFQRISYAVDVDWHRTRATLNESGMTFRGLKSTRPSRWRCRTGIPRCCLENRDVHSGDLFQYRDPSSEASRSLRYSDRQAPILLVGESREWSPDSKSVVLLGRLHDAVRQTGYTNGVASFYQAIDGPTYFSDAIGSEARHTMEIYTAEAAHFLKGGRHSLVAGGRFQAGDVSVDSVSGTEDPSDQVPFVVSKFRAPFERWSLYVYDTMEVLDDRVWLTAGGVVDAIRYPLNFRRPPLFEGSQQEHQIDPKAAITWAPAPGWTVRGAYARSLGGMSLDESVRLEPSQLAGFTQAYRSLIPDSVGGAFSGQDLETWGLSVESKMKSKTYAALRAEVLSSDVDQYVGALEQVGSNFEYSPSRARNSWSFRETRLGATLDQLLGGGFSAGGSYQFLRDELNSNYPQLLDSTLVRESRFHQLGLRVAYQHPSGWYGKSEWNGYQQSARTLPGGSHLEEHFQQIDMHFGYRLRRGLGSVQFSVLNLNQGGYALDPLTVHREFPRGRVYSVRLTLQL
jgi:tetratricopeptide (TPR) repeat protein